MRQSICATMKSSARLFVRSRMLLRPTLRRSLQHSTTRHLSKASVLPTRTYLYTVDDFGRIFLDSTTSRNFTSCYRSAPRLSSSPP